MNKYMTPYGKDVYIVRDVDYKLYKCEFCDLIKEVEDEESEPKDSITITREKFRNAVEKTVRPENFKKSESDMTPYIIALSGVLVCERLEAELFGEREDGCL